MRGPSHLFTKLFLGNALLIAMVLGTCVWLIVREVHRVQHQAARSRLEAQVSALRDAIRDRFDLTHAAELDRLAKRLGERDDRGTRITLILADGTVLADSDADPADMENHAERPEVQEALREGTGEDTRVSGTLGQALTYVAVRVGPPDRPAGVARAAMRVQSIGETTAATGRLIWQIGTIGLLAAVCLALGLALVWSQPIRRITETARSLSRGDLSARAAVSGSDEMAVLARSLNQMRDHLATQLETIDRHRRTLESLVSQVKEGVVVAGPDGRLVLLNPEAIRLLDLPPAPEASFVGQPVEACILQQDLQNMLLTSLPAPDELLGDAGGSHRPATREVRLDVSGPRGMRTVLARASDIMLPRFDNGRHLGEPERRRATGRLLVLTDITTLNQMLQMKADFAANASHELRTPVSAIRAAAETLKTIDFATDSESAVGFVDMISRHSARLEAMVRDLLDLSRIESSPGSFRPQSLSLAEMLHEVRLSHADALDSRRLQWEVDRPRDLDVVLLNPYLLRAVLDNLVDNAIKFTEPGGHVRITCREKRFKDGQRGSLTIEVTDDGCGIPEQDLDRIFERFYQVKRERSGPDRGTGLGLSIVRHAVLAMRGTLDVKSTVGEGTSFTVTFAQPADA